jgi:hypothetical protein
LARWCWASVSAALRVVVHLHVAEASIGASRCGGGLDSSASSCGGPIRLRVVANPLAVELAPLRHQRIPMGFLFRR